jgi:WD40 repeat protein
MAERNLDRTLRESGPAIVTIRFSRAGKLVASGGVEDQIQIWDVTRPKGQELVTALPAVGGANRLGFNDDGTVLGFGSDARYISLWSTSTWDKILQLNALVGVRSIFDFHPSRGDLAFDGEGGLIRILSRQDQAAEAAQGGAVLRGMDVYFDDLPVNFGTDQDSVTVRAAFEACDARRD